MDIRLSVGGFGGSCIATRRGDEALKPPFYEGSCCLLHVACARGQLMGVDVMGSPSSASSLVSFVGLRQPVQGEARFHEALKHEA